MRVHFLVLASFLFLFCFSARVDASPSGSLILVSDRSPIELHLAGSSYRGEFTIANHGRAPLVVSRIAIRDDADDPRLPHEVTLTLDGREARTVVPITLAPQSERRVAVLFTPQEKTRARQLFGHVVVTSTDETRGEVAVGIHAQRSHPAPFGFIEAHLLSFLILVPLLGALFSTFVFLRKKERFVRPVTRFATAIQAALGIWLWIAFDPELSPIDGNDGLQFIEHLRFVPAVGAEYFVAASGWNVTSIALVAVVSFVASIAMPRPKQHVAAFDALFLFLSASGVAALASEDAVLWLASVAVMLVTFVYALVFFGSGPSGAKAKRTSSAILGLGFAALVLAIVFLHATSDPALLVSGDRIPHSFSFPELARVSFVSKQTAALGFPVAKTAWVFGFVGMLAISGLFPLHLWLTRSSHSLPAPIAALAFVTVTAVGLQTLVRFSMVLPESARWAAHTTLVLGFLGSFCGALATLVARDGFRLAGYGVVAQGGLVLTNMASLDAQGVASGLVGIPAITVSAALWILACGILETKLGTREMRDVRGLAKEAPWLSVLLVIGGLGLMAAPTSVVGWSILAGVFGSAPRGLSSAVATLLVVLLLSFGVTRFLHGLLSGTLPDTWQKNARLEPFGGHISEIHVRSSVSLGILALILIGFGFYPAPLFAAASSTTRDLARALNPPGPGEISQR